MSDQNRIESLQRLVDQNPNDELAQFSLGQALLESGRPKEAGPCFQRVLALNSQHSKAFELLGRSQKEAGDTNLAIETLKNGYRIAQRKGDMMPMQGMAKLLKELGAEPPQVAEKKEGAVGAKGDGSCRRCGGSGPMLTAPPFKGELGQTIFKTVCASCWKEWIGMGTKVINELRLPMYDPQAQETYDKHMKDFLLIEV